MIATGNHVIYDSLCGAPLPEGAKFVILSEPTGEPKNLRTDLTAVLNEMRRSFDYATLRSG